MLTICPECGLQVSDKAVICPHCGYPLKTKNIIPKKSSRKRRKLPNGFGQITELKGRNLKRPFRAMVSAGKRPDGRTISKLLEPVAYFETYNDAYEALLKYNKHPSERGNEMTVEELYDLWSVEYSNEKENSSLLYVWRLCEPLKKTKITDLHSWDIKNLMDAQTAVVNGKEIKVGEFSAIRIKTLFNLMLDYAVKYEFLDKNVSRLFSAKSPQRESETHRPYTDEEISTLWTHADDIVAKFILVQCYSGWRPRELLEMSIENVNITEKYFTGGKKTVAGKNRLVPIHPKIYGLVSEMHRLATAVKSDKLIFKMGEHGPETFTYGSFVYQFRRHIEMIGIKDHKAHDGRVHFVTECKKYNVDEYAIKYLVGHAIGDITERVYTKRNNEWLREEIEKIK